MKKIIFSLMILGGLLSACYAINEKSEPKAVVQKAFPVIEWEKGDTWEVEYEIAIRRANGEKQYIKYTYSYTVVIADKNKDKQALIHMEEVDGDISANLLFYYSEDDIYLLKADVKNRNRISTHENKKENSAFIPTLIRSDINAIIAFPRLPLVEETFNVDKSMTTTQTLSKVEIEIAGNNGGVTSFQTWEAGKKWWSHCVRKEYNNTAMTGKLLSE